MLPVHRILHPTDFSEGARGAFRLACALARDCDAELVVLSVVPLPAVMYGPPPESYLEHLREHLSRMRPPDAGTRFQHLVAEGNPATAILNAARANGCDLIVMGTHGRTGLSRFLKGSVAEEVVRKAPCPVLTVKGGPGAVPASASPVFARLRAG
jgi:nucleotide-binding universal stress UspA family protein